MDLVVAVVVIVIVDIIVVSVVTEAIFLSLSLSLLKVCYRDALLSCCCYCSCRARFGCLTDIAPGGFSQTVVKRGFKEPKLKLDEPSFNINAHIKFAR